MISAVRIATRITHEDIGSPLRQLPIRIDLIALRAQLPTGCSSGAVVDDAALFKLWLA